MDFKQPILALGVGALAMDKLFHLTHSWVFDIVKLGAFDHKMDRVFWRGDALPHNGIKNFIWKHGYHFLN